MCDQSKDVIKYSDLLRFTSTYRMLFIPYLYLYKRDLHTFIFGTDVFKSVINVYPYWEGHEGGLDTGHVFLVLRSDRMPDDKLVDLIIRDDVYDYRIEDSEYPEYLVFKIALDKNVCKAFEDGKFSAMFDHEELKANYKVFLNERTGILAPINDTTSKKLAKTYHILTRSSQYERILAFKLGVDYDDFADKLEELAFRQPTDMDMETLRLSILSQQIKSYEQRR